MVSWICPECACECAPTDHECPDCTDLVHAGMLALAQTVQTQLGSLPPLPPVQGLVSTRFAHPKAPAPLSLWPIDAEAESAGVLGLFVPCLAASVQLDRLVEPEPVSAEIPPAALAEPVLATEPDVEFEPPPVEIVPEEVALAPTPVETPEEGSPDTMPEEVAAVEPEIADAHTPQEDAGDSHAELNTAEDVI